ncbi:MAG TPA: ROK family protein [Kiritimatiellia bacterium]|nr:ROK family protein [Kiritimatiellia bacterium]HRZ11983.1 ROK family protein [Kiritimatiellia bacterium]HSA17211.1 ROK family protein [Kiritimatiellia bacterium]
MNLLGIDLGGTKTSVCIGDENGTIRAARRIPTLASEGPESGLRRTAGLARALLDETGLDPARVDAVGISAPGPVSVREGLMLRPPNMPGWVDVPLVRWAQDSFGRPVFMNNDANACALAEYRYGSCRGTPNLVYLTMSTGLGAGIVLDGNLVQGATDLAGEVGHHVLDIRGPPCPCGQRGCLEIYCGGKNVADRLRARIVKDNARSAILGEAGGDPAAIDFRAFLAAVKKDDALALEFWEEYLERLAQGVGTVIMFFNPQVILMGTIAIHAGEFLLAPLRERVRRYAWAPSVAACRILPSALEGRIGDLSALAVAADGLPPRV